MTTLKCVKHPAQASPCFSHSNIVVMMMNKKMTQLILQTRRFLELESDPKFKDNYILAKYLGVDEIWILQ
jgi:hypothetical protein